MTTFESSFDFNMNMKIVIILKMSFLFLPTILDLMLVLVSENYFDNLSWQCKQVIYHVFWKEISVEA